MLMVHFRLYHDSEKKTSTTFLLEIDKEVFNIISVNKCAPNRAN